MIYGWDISTSIVGTAIFTSTGKYLGSNYTDLRDVEGPIDKAYAVEGVINHLAEEMCQSGKDREMNTHFIEDKLSSFAGGRTMQQTLLKLAGFNSVISYLVWRQFYTLGLPVQVEHIHPSTVKAIMKRQGLLIPKGADKKALTLEFVSKAEPLFPVHKNRNGNPQPYCYDMADAYIVARAGYLRWNEQRKQEP